MKRLPFALALAILASLLLVGLCAAQEPGKVFVPVSSGAALYSPDGPIWPPNIQWYYDSTTRLRVTPNKWGDIWYYSFEGGDRWFLRVTIYGETTPGWIPWSQYP